MFHRRFKRAAIILVALSLFKVAHCAVAVHADDAEQRLRYLAERIDTRDLPGLAPGPPFDGEWLLVEHSFAVAAATNLAFRHPETSAEHRVQVKRWLERMLGDDVRAFDASRWKEDALTSLQSSNGHAGYLGHLAWSMGASCLVGNGLHERAPAVAATLSRRFDGSPSVLIETYPGETYVPDNVVAIAGLSLLQRCAPALHHQRTVARFLEVMRSTRLDSRTGVLVFAPGQEGRGSGAAWMAYFLSFVDEPFSREQFDALFREFGVTLPYGAVALREWPRGVERSGDLDSGPLVFGLSPAATGFALAGPALANDSERLWAMRLTAEAAGTSFRGRFLFAPLVGDAIVLATSTATPWTTSAHVR